MHGNLNFSVPECDLCVCAGDFSPLAIQRNYKPVLTWTQEEFIPWVMRQPCKKFVFIAGNHDFVCENPNWKTDLHEIFVGYGTNVLDKIVYLENESADVLGLRVFGCPYSDIPRWAFSISTKDERGYKQIEPDVDLLIVHQAPKFENVGTSNIGTWREHDWGSTMLLKEIEIKKPHAVVCGHIHSGNHGAVQFNGTTIYNASMLDEQYELAYQPQQFIIAK